MKRASFCLPTHGKIETLAFLSVDSSLVICGDNEGNISLFSTKSSKIVWTNKDDSFGNFIWSVAVSPNDDIVAGGGFKKCLFVINASNGVSICSVDVGSAIWRVLFLSQQKIACGLDNGTVAIVCWQTQKIEKILTVGEKTVFALAISPVNNDILLTGDYDGVIKQTIISSEKTVMVYEGHTDAVNDLKFLSCGNMFVSGSWDGTSRLFSLDQKQAIQVFKGHTNTVISVSLIHDDDLLITASYDGEAKVWEIDSGECVFTVEAGHDIYSGAVSKDDQSLIVGGPNGQMTIFSLPCLSLDHSRMVILLQDKNN